MSRTAAPSRNQFLFMLLTLSVIVGLPFLFALLALLVGRLDERWAGWLSLLPPAVVVALGFPLWREFGGGGQVIVPVEWFPALGLTANLRVDRLGAFFILLIGGVGLGIVQYSRHYLKKKATAGFWALLLAFMGSMLGVVVADSLLLLFVFWELTTISSALLIGLEYSKEDARRGAIQAFLVTGAGGLALLAGIVLLGQMAGSYDLSGLVAQKDVILADPWHLAPLLLILAGAFAKSAQYPFHFWLPGAMAASMPVSAYLHSATMVKAGVFLLGRFFPVFADSPVWLPLLVVVGTWTFLVGGWHAIRAHDLKQLLAHSTVAYLGVLTAYYGYAAVAGLQGEILSYANHALYKCGLFLLLGWIEKRTGTRDLQVLRREHWFPGEWVAAVLVGVGACAMAGLPLVLGFMSKEVLVYAILDMGAAASPVLVILALAGTVVGSALAFGYAGKLLIHTFWGAEAPAADRGLPRHRISVWLLAVPGVFLVPQVVGGITPGWLLSRFLEPGLEWPSGLAFWHYLDAALVVSLVIFGLGAICFAVWDRLAGFPQPVGAPELFGGLAGGTVAHASWLSRSMQRGGHPRFISVTVLAVVAAMIGGVFWGTGWPQFHVPAWGVDLHLGWMPAVAVIGAAILVVALPMRVPKIIMMAVVGYGLAVFYVLFRAPDLALTQLLVETISVVLLLLVFRRMPPLLSDPRPFRLKLGHGAVALCAGAAVTTLAWAAGSHSPETAAGMMHLDLSVPVAKGENVVNVILVDFRAMDTLGEIVVLAIAALGALALAASTQFDRKMAEQPRQPKRFMVPSGMTGGEGRQPDRGVVSGGRSGGGFAAREEE